MQAKHNVKKRRYQLNQRERPDFLTLSNLGGGATEQMFAEELEKVLANIQDPNTSPTKMRTITLKITIKPNEDRNVGAVGLDCKSTIAPSKPFATQIFMGREQGQFVAVENAPPEQLTLFGDQSVTQLSSIKQ